MTRHYTHIGDLAVSQAVASLPSISGEAKPVVAIQDYQQIFSDVQKIVSGMTQKNCLKTKSVLLKLLKGVAV